MAADLILGTLAVIAIVVGGWLILGVILRGVKGG